MPGETRRIDLEADGEDLADVLERLGQRVGKTIVVDPNVEEVVRVSLRGIPWREAVEVIARMTRCEVQRRGTKDGEEVLFLTQVWRVWVSDLRGDLRAILQSLSCPKRKAHLDFGEIHPYTLTYDCRKCQRFSVFRGFQRKTRNRSRFP